MDELIFALLFIVLVAYVFVFYFAFFNSVTKRKKKVRFHNAVICDQLILIRRKPLHHFCILEACTTFQFRN